MSFVPVRPIAGSAEAEPDATPVSDIAPRTVDPAPIGISVPDMGSPCPLVGFCGSGAPMPEVTVILSKGGDLAGLDDILAGLGLDPATPATASLPVRRGQVRYFREGDLELAELLAARTGYDLLDLTWYRPQPAVATIEMRVPGPGAKG